MEVDLKFFGLKNDKIWYREYDSQFQYFIKDYTYIDKHLIVLPDPYLESQTVHF